VAARPSRAKSRALLEQEHRNGGGRRALSLAFALCDVLRLCRDTTIYKVGEEDWRALQEDPAPNTYVYATAKAARALVV
jgi:hypothetical protein